MDENPISKEIVDAAFKIHQALGPGLLESVYEVTLAYELRKRGLSVERQSPVQLKYEELVFEEGYRLDLIVEDKVIVEVKSIEEILPIHKKQLLTYLRLSNIRLGLLINFNVAYLPHGIRRVILTRDYKN